MKNWQQARQIILFISFLFVFAILHSQDKKDKIVFIETKDGNNYRGTIVTEDENTITILSDEIGTITLKKNTISRLTEYSKDDKFEGYPLQNVNFSRYFVNTNAYGLKEGEGYYQNSLIFFNYLGYGFYDQFSMGLGFVSTFLVGGDKVPFWINSNYNFGFAKNVRGNIGVIINNFQDGLGYIPSASITLGPKNGNLTLGYGRGYFFDDILDNVSLDYLTINCMLRVSKKMFLISENFFDTSLANGFYLFGARLATKKMSYDFGLMRSNEFGDVIGIPYVGATLSF